MTLREAFLLTDSQITDERFLVFINAAHLNFQLVRSAAPPLQSDVRTCSRAATSPISLLARPRKVPTSARHAEGRVQDARNTTTSSPPFGTLQSLQAISMTASALKAKLRRRKRGERVLKLVHAMRSLFQYFLDKVRPGRGEGSGEGSKATQRERAPRRPRAEARTCTWSSATPPWAPPSGSAGASSRRLVRAAARRRDEGPGRIRARARVHRQQLSHVSPHVSASTSLSRLSRLPVLAVLAVLAVPRR